MREDSKKKIKKSPTTEKEGGKIKNECERYLQPSGHLRRKNVQNDFNNLNTYRSLDGYRRPTDSIARF